MKPEIHIRLLSLSGGSDGEITVKAWPNRYADIISWSRDGRGLYCGAAPPQGSALLYVDLKGNSKVLWALKSGYRTWGLPSPDGRYLAILGTESNANVWMFEGF